MKGKSGLHDGALAAGLQTTVTSKAAREAFGYTEFVTKSDAVIRWYGFPCECALCRTFAPVEILTFGPSACVSSREWFNEPAKSVIEKRVVPQLDPLEHLYLLVPQQ